MKLTQTTLFRCFEKSQRQSPIIIDEKEPGTIFTSSFLEEKFHVCSHISLDIIECELEIKPASPTPSHPVDFLLPIHIRQEGNCLQDEIIPRLKQWKFNDVDDDLSSNYLHTFHRIYPTVNQQKINSPKLQVFDGIVFFSSSHLLVCFYSSLSQSQVMNIKWNSFNNIPMIISVLTLNRPSIGKRCFTAWKIIVRKPSSKVDHREIS